MPVGDTLFTTIAGEHYVAHKLALLGLVPAPVRQGVRSLDMLVANQSGSRSVAVHVESAASATRDDQAGEPEGRLQFPLSQRSLEQAADTSIFCFVDLKVRQPHRQPDVYIMTAKDLREHFDVTQLRKYSYFRYVRPAAQLAAYCNNWQPFLDALSTGNAGVSAALTPATPGEDRWASRTLREIA